MNGRIVEVTAPSRLHFGMFSFGQPNVREFGGVGAMIDLPGLRLRLEPAASLSACGPLAERALDFARQAARAWRLDREPACRVRVVSAPREHIGLGVGTQLGLSVAAGLAAFLGRSRPDSVALAECVGRGKRSAIGLRGFHLGGLIVEAGKLRGEKMSPLISRIELPAEWRFVLICPSQGSGISGEEEQAAFSRLQPVALQTTSELCREARLNLLPAATAADFAGFSESLYRFGLRAGECFAAGQGGERFSNARMTKVVEAIREDGVQGVGQTSWGPTLFALLPNAGAAQDFVERLKQWPVAQGLETSIAAPSPDGARIEVRSDSDA